ncbi:LysR family transcriptional regulator [Roseovarius sp. Pro17]|uniref:LysR family transcriptional regulator n=1 Tax=Roseovarius sp. Pro17 TaxID=3108175 RepID=UPI002D79D0E8|nr:LysR family transcriptional regulator [Roseovarius sp. Pro17]
MNTRITLKQLETLYWIVELGTFERAAERLYATQSAVSKRVQELERGAKIEIFNRNQRGAKLTGKGEELYEVAKKMLLLHDQIFELRNTESLQPRSLRIGITELVASTWFPQLVAEIRERYPQVRLEPKVTMSRDLFSDLEQDQLDLIIIPETFTLPEFVTVPIASVQNYWMARKGFLETNVPIRHRDLAEYPVLVQGRLSGSGVFLNKWLKSRGVVFPETLVCDSMSALLGLAMAGLGVTYLPYHYCKRLIEEDKLEIIETEVPLPPVPYVAVYREDRPHAFVQEVAEIAQASADFETSLIATLS